MKTELTKFCPRCKTEKSMDDFYNNKAQYDGKQSHCKECTRLYQKEYYSRPGTREAMIENAKRWRLENPDRVREHHKKKTITRFGITPEDYQIMYKAQKGRCAICRKAMERLSIDHCHKKGNVRGLLCPNCNSGLGFFKDDIKLLKGAMLYLDTSQDINICNGMENISRTRRFIDV